MSRSFLPRTFTNSYCGLLIFAVLATCISGLHEFRAGVVMVKESVLPFKVSLFVIVLFNIEILYFTLLYFVDIHLHAR